MIETIAVMAVIAILVAMLVPPIIRRVDRAAWTAETANLNTFADALTQSIISTKSIPTFTNWSSAVADQMSLPVSAVLTNGRRYARAFLVDPDLNINGSLPYTQTINGTAKPYKARVMILSSLSQALPITSGVASAPDFNNIWDAAENTVPAGTPFTGWTGTGDDLRIKKLNLEPLFYQLILFSHDPTNIPAPFSIDRGTTTIVGSGPPGWNKYYLASSDLWLINSSTNLQTRYLLNRSLGFIFESGSWRGQIQGGETFNDTNGVAASAFLTLAKAFYNKSVSTAATGTGASPSAVLVTMYTFMFDYVFWATQCPSFDYHGYGGGTPTGLPEYNMLDQMGQNSSPGGASVDAYSGNNGVLK